MAVKERREQRGELRWGALCAESHRWSHQTSSASLLARGTARPVRRRAVPLGAAMLYGRRMPGRRRRPIKGAAGAVWPCRGTRDGRRVGEWEEAAAVSWDGGGRREHCECLPCSAAASQRLFALKPSGASAQPRWCRSVPAFAAAGSFCGLSLRVLSSLAVPLAPAFPFSSCEPCGLSGTASRVRGRLGASPSPIPLWEHVRVTSPLAKSLLLPNPDSRRFSAGGRCASAGRDG